MGQSHQVILGCPGESKIMPERIPGYIAEMKKLEIPLVDKPEDMIGKVDGIMIKSQEGGAHLERARPFLEAGLPCFIDKPFTCSVADARKIADLAGKKKTPVFSSSSLHYTAELVEFMKDDKHGKLVGALTYGSAPLFEKDAGLNPGLYHYGIHAVEMLYTLMGPGCEHLTCTHSSGVDVVTGQWKDGRVGTVRGIRPKADYGFVAFAEKGVYPVAAKSKFGYRDLLKEVVAFFTTKKAPVPIAVTVEIMAFIEAANRSGINHGVGAKVETGG